VSAVRTCVVVVNWNGWADTLACLESLLRADLGPGATVVVVDNASTDGSPERIRAWAEGRLDAWITPASPLRALVHPPLPKPVSLVECGQGEVGRPDPAAEAPRVVLIRAEGNLGFAGGSNLGLRWMLAHGRHDCAWLLNNDTVVDAGALRALTAELDRDPDVGMVGSTLLYFAAPGRVQALGGGTFNRWLALPRHLGTCADAGSLPSADEVNRRLDFVTGASMLVSKAFLDTVGLLGEEYFLYFEELDWTARSAGRFRLRYAPASVVYHREGGSVGSGARDGRKSAVADYHFMRARLLFTRKFQPLCLPTVYLALGVAMLRRALRGHWSHVAMIARLCMSCGGPRGYRAPRAEPHPAPASAVGALANWSR
jgi:GT2 family glycosyltransferase